MKTKDMEGSGHDLTIPTFVLRDRGKPQNTSQDR
jgi:hypothetical protein